MLVHGGEALVLSIFQAPWTLRKPVDVLDRVAALALIQVHSSELFSPPPNNPRTKNLGFTQDTAALKSKVKELFGRGDQLLFKATTPGSAALCNSLLFVQAYID